jgi:cytochrome c5
MRHPKGLTVRPLLLAAMLAIGTTAVIGQAESTPPQSQSKETPKTALAPATDRGQEVFERNCSRCHSAPEGFPPSISGTVARHMRVRAGLSEADYKALRRFLNP